VTVENHQLKLGSLPPELAKAIVAAQTAADKLRRDGKGDKGKYTTADAIAAEASRVLNEHGAGWMRTGLDFAEPGLAQSDIGNQSYVGDLVQTWMIVHESGPAIIGTSRMPVVTSRGRPPDKATAASLTYDVGQILRGALCMERESENAIDRREDVDDGSQYRHGRQESRRTRDNLGPRCTGAAAGIARSITESLADLSGILDKPQDKVYGSALRKYIDLSKYGSKLPTPAQLTVDDGKIIKDTLAAKLAEVSRQPGDDPDEDADPTAGSAP